MTVRRNEDGIIVMEGQCPLDESEILFMLISESIDPVVEWSSCTEAHAAVVQVLLVTRPRLIGIPQGSFLRNFIAPCIGSETASNRRAS